MRAESRTPTAGRGLTGGTLSPSYPHRSRPHSFSSEPHKSASGKVKKPTEKGEEEEGGSGALKASTDGSGGPVKPCSASWSPSGCEAPQAVPGPGLPLLDIARQEKWLRRVRHGLLFLERWPPCWGRPVQLEISAPRRGRGGWRLGLRGAPVAGRWPGDELWRHRRWGEGAAAAGSSSGGRRRGAALTAPGGR